MNWKIISLLIFVISTIFSSCNESAANNADNIELKHPNIDSLNKVNTTLLINKYHASFRWDTAKLFSFEITKLFSDTNKLFSIKGFVTDISTKDTNYIIKFMSGNSIHYNEYIMELRASKHQIDQILTNLNRHKPFRGEFIFKPLYTEVSRTITGIKGVLIDYYIFKNNL